MCEQISYLIFDIQYFYEILYKVNRMYTQKWTTQKNVCLINLVVSFVLFPRVRVSANWLLLSYLLGWCIFVFAVRKTTLLSNRAIIVPFDLYENKIYIESSQGTNIYLANWKYMFCLNCLSKSVWSLAQINTQSIFVTETIDRDSLNTMYNM